MWKKYIRSDKNGEYKSHCAEICLESGISIKLLSYSPQSNEKSNVTKMMDTLFISLGLHKTCVEELFLL